MFKLYATLAALLLLVGMGTTLYFKGAQNARQKAVIASLKDTVANQQAALAKYREAYANDQLLAAQMAAEAAQFQIGSTNLDVYFSTLGDRDSVVFSAADVDRLRVDLWGIPPAGSPTHPK